jgi:hypothetical protein
MEIKLTDRDGVAVTTPKIFRDARGYFTETESPFSYGQLYISAETQLSGV